LESPELKAVVALGGNALVLGRQRGTAREQIMSITSASLQLARLIKQGHQIVLTHGNGPQIGNLLIQQEFAKVEVPQMPLNILGAMTQGQIGYLIQQSLTNALDGIGLQRDVVTVITRVAVRESDRAFRNPTKPIGPFYTREEAERLASRRGYTVKMVQPRARRSYRRVVPSPEPTQILEREVIRALLESRAIVIAGGGGGIPVIRIGKGSYKGIEAVIDKDLTAEKIAEDIRAETLLILTDAQNVKLNFGKKNEKSLGSVSLAEAKKYLGQGQFLSGSMEPKVLACVRFLEAGGKQAIIASLEDGANAIRGESGTRFLL
jgi:carbamate kinase